MFSGIIESLGRVEKIIPKHGNLNIWISCSFIDDIYIDQSIAHDGCCLTVDALESGCYRVTAIAETLDKTNLKSWYSGYIVNLERSIRAGGRMDGHFMQGHVDTCGSCIKIDEKNGSWEVWFSCSKGFESLIVSKGSIAINGVSLTLVDLRDTEFSVHIIPYTFHHSNFQNLKIGDKVNIEFDIIGKYVTRWMSLRAKS